MAHTRSAEAVYRSRKSQMASVSLDYRPSYLAAGIAALLTFFLYLLTLAPSTAMWDTSEYIAAAYVLGLPHPPGNPFFVLLGKFFTLLPIGTSIAVKVNLLAAVCSSVSAGMWFLIAERVLVGWFPQRWQRIAGGALATLIGATAFTVWSQSVVNEKVYTVSLVGVAIISWLTVKWCDDPEGGKSDKLLILIAYLLGLGYANHMAGFIAAPAVAIAVLVRRPQTLLRWRLILTCIAVLLLGMTPFATQPIRAAHFPAINEGEPTGCRTEFGWGCTFSKQTLEAFKYNFNRGQYSKPPLSERQASFTDQLGMWWLYFKWQWLRDPYMDAPRLQAMLGAVFLMLGLFGGYVHWRRDRRSFMYFGPLMFTMTFLLIYYLNFKLGASQGGTDCDMQPEICEVRDRDYFFLWSFSAWSVWAALGLVFVWETLAALIGASREQVGQETVEVPHRSSWLKASPILLLAVVPLFTNWNAASRKGETDTRDFAHDMLNSVEPYGVLVTVGDNDTFPLWYAQEVEGIRKDVTVFNMSLGNTDWYVRQLIRRPVFEYDRDRGPRIYRDGDWPIPTGPAIRMSLDEADRIELARRLDGERRFAVEGTGLSTTIRKGEIYKAEHVILRILLDSHKERPLYISRTAGSLGRELGLERYLLTQGLAQKVMLQVPAAASGDTILTQNDEWYDVRRSKDLWDSVFVAKSSLIRKNKWIDFPSQGIPFLYFYSGVGLWEALALQGKEDEGQKVLHEALQIAEAVRIEEGYGAGVVNRLRALLRPETGSGGSATPKALDIPGKGGG